MVKLSELNMEDMLYIEGEYGDSIMTKTEVLDELDYIKQEGKKIYTTHEYEAKVNAKYVIDWAIEDEYQNMHEDWDLEAMREVTEEDIEDIQKVFDRILDRTNRVSYYADKEVEIDL